MRPCAQTNYEQIIMIQKEVEWIKKMIFGIFAGIILNIIINLMTITRNF